MTRAHLAVTPTEGGRVTALTRAGWAFFAALPVLLVLVLILSEEINAAIAIAQFAIIVSFYMYRPWLGVLMTLALSTTMGFPSRVSLHLTEGRESSLDFIRFSIEIALMLFVAIPAIRMRVMRKRDLATLDILVVAYLLVSSLQVANTLSSGLLIPLWGWRWVCLPVLVYFLGRQFGKSERSVHRFTNMVAIVLLCLSSYAVFQMVVGIPVFEQIWFSRLPGIELYGDVTAEGSRFVAGQLRVPSLTSGHTYLSFIVAALMVYLLFMPCNRRGARLIKLMSLGAAVCYLALSLERTPIGMAVVGIGCGILLRLRIRSRVAFLMVAGLVLVGILVYLGSTVNTAHIRSVQLRRLAELATPLKAATVRWRVTNAWVPAWRLIVKNPLGYGLGITQGISLNIDRGSFLRPHNMYLQIMLEQGIAGLLLFVAILVAYVRELSELLLFRASRHFAIASLSSLLSVLAVAFFNIPLEVPLGFFFWNTLGLVTSQCKSRTT